MAAPIYDTDLTLTGHTLTSAESTADGGAWAAIGGGNITLGAGPDFSMQGVNCVDAKISNTDKGPGVPVAAFTPGVDDHIFAWVFLATPGLSDTLQNGGLCIAVGTGVSALVKFHVEGNDTYGAAGRVGKCYPVRYVNTPNVAGPNYRTLLGSPGATPSFVGATTKINGTVRGSNIGVDAIRYGTGMYITGGDSGIPANFINAAAQNDATANRWGVLTKVGAGYELQGRFAIGRDANQAASPAYFSAANTTVAFVDTPHSLPDFTQFIVDHASTYCALNNVTFKALGTWNRGKFTFNNALSTGILVSTTFEGIGATVLQAGVTATDSVWRGCDQVAVNGATVSGGSIESTTDASGALVASSPSDMSALSNIEFKANAVAIKITAPGTYTFDGHIFTGNTVQVDFTGTGSCVINPVNGCNVAQAGCTASGGGSITVNQPQVSLTLTGMPAGTDIVILDAGTVNVIHQVDQNPGNSYVYAYTDTKSVDIGFIKPGYRPLYIRNLALTASNSSIPVSLTVDPNYA